MENEMVFQVCRISKGAFTVAFAWWAAHSHISASDQKGSSCWKHHHFKIVSSHDQCSAALIRFLLRTSEERPSLDHLQKPISEFSIKQPLTKCEFVNRICKIWKTYMKEENVISGFEMTGNIFFFSILGNFLCLK